MSSSKKENRRLLATHDYLIGLEREALRVTSEGALAKTSHPKALGSALMHPFISTDFAESQLELISPPKASIKAVERCIRDIERFILQTNTGELLWPLSMPSHLGADVAVAEYGSSPEGQLKKLYREGLVHRYGRNMQLISGIHYNFSLSDAFWQALHAQEQSKAPLQDFISEKYLHLCRNFLRYGWIVTYFYGASPTCDRSFGAQELERFDATTDYAPYATSLRMSHHGYYSRVQEQLTVSFNSVEEYLRDMEHALQTPSKEYASITQQINDNILQIQNEHYTRIRPKYSLERIRNEGIRYIEVRSIDLDPYHALGIGVNQLAFIKLFLLYCLYTPSPPLTKREQQRLCQNQNEVALRGRDPKAIILEEEGRAPLREKAHALIDELMHLQSYCPECNLSAYKEAIDDPSKTLSGKILADMQKNNESHTDFGMRLAKRHAQSLTKTPLPRVKRERFIHLSEQSLEKQANYERCGSLYLSGYEDMELSTQVLLREAFRCNLEVEILDRKANIIRINSEIIRQATKTSRDSYITYELLGNKQVTKKLLETHNIATPQGRCVTSLEEARAIYPEFSQKKCIVKPNTTNYGIGVHAIPPENPELFEKAVRDGLTHDDTILIEECIPGKEYRFLVINGDVIGVLYRDPANVIGDGEHTIAQLVRIKNEDPTSNKPPKEYIRLRSVEKNYLALQGYTTKYIPAKGQKIYLRENSNVSTGGDPIDVTDVIHPYYKNIAQKAASALNATFAGVDMLLDHPSKKGSYGIIEVNYNPAIAMHAFPYRGAPRPVARAILDTLNLTSSVSKSP